MTSLFRNAAGIDFDNYFDLNKSGEFAANVNARTSDGTDLSRRYELLKYGSQAANVNCRDAAGVDFATKWAAKGSAIYTLGFNGKSYFTGREALTNQQGNISASVTIAISNDGTWSIGADTGSPVSGTWLPAGRSASEYSVQIVAAGQNRATFASTAANYANCATTQSATATATVRAQSSDQIDESVTVTVNLRDSSGLVTTSTFSARVFAHGWV